MNAKEKFMAVAEKWADLLIAEAQRSGADNPWYRENVAKLTVPQVVYVGKDGTVRSCELPEEQRKVWQAGNQLLVDAYDEAKAQS